MGEPLSQAEIWKDVLENEKSPLHKHFRLYGMLPSSPRCKLCHAPFWWSRGSADAARRQRAIENEPANVRRL
jgi:hypothetical protein